MKRKIQFAITLSLLLLAGCASFIYDFNYSGDKDMRDAMMGEYGDPFWR